MSYTTFRNFVDTARNRRVSSVSALSANQAHEFNASLPSVLNTASDLTQVDEGVIDAFFSGYHIYAMVELKKSWKNSATNEDRKRVISVLADTVVEVREVVHEFGGALLEAQGPVVHAFIPSEDGSLNAPREAARAISSLLNGKIKSRAGDSFVKGLVAYCHGQSLFIASVDSHGDNSIVSLAPAANVPAKVLWRRAPYLASGSILEVALDGTYTILSERDLRHVVANSSAFNESALVAMNASTSFSNVRVINRKVSMPHVGSSDSPTVMDPQESYSISVRADIDGFSRQVKDAFDNGPEAVRALAKRFHAIMVHARSFGKGIKAIHLPWAGDCFNLLLAVDDRQTYQENRRRKILEVVLDFRNHMQDAFPEIQWSFSCAAGDLENAQKCNTLVSRMTVGQTSILLAAGLPVERSLEGLASEQPKAGCGLLWREDVNALDPRLREAIKTQDGGGNFRHFTIDSLQRAALKTHVSPALPVYVPSNQKAAVAVPTVRPYFRNSPVL